MKRILILLPVLFILMNSSAQFIYIIKADSVLITNDSCTAELNLENSTKNIKGFLYNKGNGRTEFRRAVKLNDTTFIFGIDTLIMKGSGSGVKLSQVDSAIKRVTGHANVVFGHCVLVPTWNGSSTSWTIAGESDAHDTLFFSSVSVASGSLIVDFPDVDFVCGFQANWDDVLQKNLYAIGPTVNTHNASFAIWKNFNQADFFLGSDLLNGSYFTAGGNLYRVKCDTATGIFTVDLAFNTSIIINNTVVQPGNYYGTFPQNYNVQIRRKSTTSVEFYLVDGSGNLQKGLLTTNHNFFVEISGRHAVDAAGENFGSGAAIFLDAAFIKN